MLFLSASYSCQINLEDKRKENRLSLYIIQNHPASRTSLRHTIITYHKLPLPDTLIHNILFCMPTITPFITRPATSGKQLKNEMSCHHQCMINLNFKLYKTNYFKSLFMYISTAVAISNIANYNHNVKSLFQSALRHFNVGCSF